MKKNKYVELVEPEEEQIDYSKLSLGGLQIIIGELEEKPWKGRAEKNVWKNSLNKLFEIYNSKAEHKTYNLIK